MKKLIIIITILIIGAIEISAQNDDSNALIKKANEAYVNKEYRLASELYEQIVIQGLTAPELHYNLGNAYYKQEKYPLAILNYERAIKQNNNFEDAKNNLKLANQHLRDQIKNIPESNFSAITEQLTKSVGLDSWAWITIICLTIGLALFLLYFWSEQTNWKKFSFSFGCVFVILCFVALALGFYNQSILQQTSDAIITQNVVTAKSSPDDSGTDLFRIHEGLKVAIKSKSSDWIEIRLSDGRAGWVKAECLEKI